MPASKPQRQSDDRANIELVNSAPGALDSLDRKIITRLQRDGRRAYGAIAEEIGLSEAAVRRRVQRLKDSGVMQIVAITDPSIGTDYVTTGPTGQKVSKPLPRVHCGSDF